MDVLSKIESTLQKKRDLLVERGDLKDVVGNIKDPETKKAFIDDQVDESFSIEAGRSLRREYSRKSWPYFEMYGRLRLAAMGLPSIERSHVEEFIKAASLIEKQIRGAFVTGEMSQLTQQALRSMKGISQNEGDKRNAKRAAFAAEKILQVTMVLAGEKNISLDTQRDPDGVSGFVKLVAGTGTAQLSDEEQNAILKGIGETYSTTIEPALRRTFKPDGMPFFNMYARLRMWEKGLNSIRRNEVEEFFYAIQFIRKKLDDAIISADLRDARIDLRKHFRRILKGPEGTRKKKIAREAGQYLLELMTDVAKSQDIYFRRRKLSPFWFKLNTARSENTKLQDISDEDPEHYALEKKKKALYKALEDDITRRIVNDGLKPKKDHIWRRPVMLGIDPATEGEGTETEQIVYDTDGEKLSMDEYMEKRKRERKAYNKLKKKDLGVFPQSLESLDRVPSEDIEQAIRDGATVEYMAITDDADKQNALTRNFPCVEIDGKKVVAGNVTTNEEGEIELMPDRFTGMEVDDMVNMSGRLIEGVAYNYSPQTGTTPMEVKAKGGLVVTSDREPYVTIADDGKFYLRIPSGDDYTYHRNAVRAIEKNPMVEYVKKIEGLGDVVGQKQDYTYQTVFKFEDEALPLVIEKLGGFVMSESASKKADNYYRDAKVRDDAVREQRLRSFKPDMLGGFKESRMVKGEEKQFKLNSAQLEALSYLDSNGGRGIAALETGVGKTVLTLAYIQDLKRKGLLDNGKKVLFVAPKSLKGNLGNQAEKFISDPEEFMSHVEVMAPGEFRNDAKKSAPGEPLELKEDYMDQWAAVIFDEITDYGVGGENISSSQIAQAINMPHPRKVMLTASPLESSPKQLYALWAHVNNVDVFNTGEERTRMLNFVKKHCERLGSREIALSEDPDIRETFQRWAKKNMYYASKSSVEGYDLPELKPTQELIEMDDEVAKKHRRIIKRFSKRMAKYARDLESIENSEGPFKIGHSEVSREEWIEHRKLKLIQNVRKKRIGHEDMKIAQELSLIPSKHVKGARNPKIDRCVSIVDEGMGNGKRFVIFTDNNDAAGIAVKDLCSKIPGDKHAVAYSDRWEIWANGKKLETFKEKAYEIDGREYKKEEWVDYIIDNHVKPAETNVRSVVLTQNYSHGVNLQTFSSVIHLDRDDWNSEVMKQRSARVHRQGQQNAVDQHTLDSSYEQDDSDLDFTLDQAMEKWQDYDANLFNQIVIQSQDADLSKGIGDIEKKRSSFYALDSKLMRMELSPYIKNLSQDLENTDQLKSVG